MDESWKSPVVHNVAGALSVQARDNPDRAAMHYPAGLKRGQIDYRSCSYRELDELSNQWARGLQEAGIGRGVRTALMVPPGLDFFAIFFALFKAGAVPVLIDPGIGIKPLGQCLAEAEPEAFIGVTRAQVARVVLRWAPGTIKRVVTIGPRLGWGGHSARRILDLGARNSGPVLEATRPDELAAILFTSGSTGIPKGVVYRHQHFTAQVDMLRSAFRIEPGDINLPTFPPFALFDPALGMTSVIPLMDPTRPARADPRLLQQAIERFGVTTVFGSPALLRVLAEHAEENQVQLDSVKRIISAGAAVPLDVIRSLEKHLPHHARVYTPYGATECLPVSNVSNVELDEVVENQTRSGQGICVGRPVSPNRVGIIAISDEPVKFLSGDSFLPPGAIGEIVVHGPTTTDQYWRREEQTRLAKCTDLEGVTWHRMGDVGYLDDSGRLWYCGRKSQRVQTGDQTLYTDQLEAFFNTHPDVRRTALVGTGKAGAQTAVLCVELISRANRGTRERVRDVLIERAASDPRTRSIRTVLFHPGFPVDIRHNAKIGREKLAKWAEEKMR
jgi:acyl-CoA synthetase (AMP-forming)/AMP-acid ligase II